MKKLILCSTMFFSMLALAPVTQAAIDWSKEPWRLYDVSYVKGGMFGPYFKVCYWRKTGYDSVTGSYQAKLAATYTSKYGACPAPLEAGNDVPLRTP